MNITYKPRKSKFIHEFQHQASDIICPSFYVFGWGHRCSFDPPCSYCYLNLTFRYENSPIVYQSDKVLDEVKEWLSSIENPSVLNAGELCDSFMIPQNKLFADVMNLFEEQNKHKLLFLTKSNVIPKEIEDNVYSKVYNQTIFSFSLNSGLVATTYEKGAPHTFERIACAYRLKKLKQHVRVRIDPIIEIKDFKEEYQNVINVLNDFLQPKRITLGSLRFFKNLPNFAKDKGVFKYGIDQHDGDGRLRLQLEKRIEIYRWLINNLKCEEIGLCKETSYVCHEVLDLSKVIKCNCTI